MADTTSFLDNFYKNNDLMKIIVGSVGTTVSQFTRTPVTTGQPVLMSQRTGTSDVVAAAVIRFDGTPFSFELFLGFSRVLLFQLFESAFSQQISSVAEGQDLAGEILNIAFGTVDPMMSAKGVRLKSSFPVNLNGPTLESLKSKLPGSSIVFPYLVAGKEFRLELFPSEALKFPWKYTPKALK